MRVPFGQQQSHKYDRYLADVFVGAKAGEPFYLNNAWLAAGHAVPKKAWEFSDWEPDFGQD